MVFEAKLTFVGVEDRFDGSAQGFEEPGGGTVGFALVGRPEQGQARIGQGGLELGAGIVLVPDDDLAGSGR